MVALGAGTAPVHAQPAELISIHRGLEITGFAEDESGDMQFNFRMEENGATGLFDRTLTFTQDSPEGLFTIDSAASQFSDIIFSPTGFHMTGQLDIAAAIRLTEVPDDPGNSNAVSTSASFLNLVLNSSLPMKYELNGSGDLVGQSGGGFNAFDFSEVWLGGASSFQHQGIAAPGEHSINGSILIGPSSAVPGEDFAHGTMSFEIRGHVVPTPAAVGPGLLLLTGMLLRRRPREQT